MQYPGQASVLRVRCGRTPLTAKRLVSDFYSTHPLTRPAGKTTSCHTSDPVHQGFRGTPLAAGGLKPREVPAQLADESSSPPPPLYSTLDPGSG